jgi:hypothetical protein
MTLRVLFHDARWDRTLRTKCSNNRSRQTINEMALSGRCIATKSISLGVQAGGIFEFWETVGGYAKGFR